MEEEEAVVAPDRQALPQKDDVFTKALGQSGVKGAISPAAPSRIRNSWPSADLSDTGLASWGQPTEADTTWGSSPPGDPFALQDSKAMIKPRKWMEKDSNTEMQPLGRPVQIKPRRWRDEVEETSVKPIQMRPVQIKRRPGSYLGGGEEEGGDELGQQRTEKQQTSEIPPQRLSALVPEDRRRLDRRPIVVDPSLDRSKSQDGGRRRPSELSSSSYPAYGNAATDRSPSTLGDFAEPAESNFQKELQNIRRKSFDREISLGREMLKEKPVEENREYAIPKSFKNFKETYALPERKKEVPDGPFFSLDMTNEADIAVPFKEIKEEAKKAVEVTTSSPAIFLPTMNPEPTVITRDDSVSALKADDFDTPVDKETEEAVYTKEIFEEEKMETSDVVDVEETVDVSDSVEIAQSNDRSDAEKSYDYEENKEVDDEETDNNLLSNIDSTATVTLKSADSSIRNMERMKDIEFKEKMSELRKQASGQTEADNAESEDDDTSTDGPLLDQLRSSERQKDLELLTAHMEAAAAVPSTQSPFQINRVRSGITTAATITEAFPSTSRITTAKVIPTTSPLPPLGNLSDENEYSKTHLRLQKIRARVDPKSPVKAETVTLPALVDTTLIDISGPEENRYSKTHMAQMKTKKNTDKKSPYEDFHVKDIIKKIPVAKLNKLLKKSGFVVSDLFRKEPEAMDIVLDAMKNNDFSADSSESEEASETEIYPKERQQYEETSDNEETESENPEDEEKLIGFGDESIIKIPWPKRKADSQLASGKVQDDSSPSKNQQETYRKPTDKKETTFTMDKKSELALDKEVDTMDVKSLMKKISPMSLSEVLQKVGFSLPDVIQGNKAAIKAVLKFHQRSTLGDSQPERQNADTGIMQDGEDEEDQERNEEEDQRKKWQPKGAPKVDIIDSSPSSTTAKWKPSQSDSPKITKPKLAEGPESSTAAYPPRWQPSTAPTTAATEVSEEPAIRSSGGKIKSAVDLFKKFRKTLKTDTTVKSSPITESDNMVTPPNDFQKFGERTTRKRYGSSTPVEEDDKKELNLTTNDKDIPNRRLGGLAKLDEKIYASDYDDEDEENEKDDGAENREDNDDEDEEDEESEPKEVNKVGNVLTTQSTVDSLNATLSNLNMTVDDLKERKDELTVPGIEKIFKDFQKEKDTDIVYGEKKTPEKTNKDKPKQFIQTDFGGGGGFRRNSQPWGGVGFGYGSMGAGLITNRLTSTTTRAPTAYFDLNGDMIEETVDVLSQDNRDLLGDYKVLDYQETAYDNPYDDYANGEVPVGVKSALIASSVVGGFAVRKVQNLFSVLLYVSETFYFAHFKDGM